MAKGRKESALDGPRDDVHTPQMFPQDDAPNSMATEYALLGCILMRNDILKDLTFLKPEHFFAPENARLYESMCQLYAEDTLLTPFSMETCLELTKGQVKYLIGAISFSISMLRPVEEAWIIIEMFNRREIMRICYEYRNEAMAGKVSASEIICSVSDDLNRVGSAGGITKFQTDRQVTELIIDRIHHRKKPYSTGLAKLDQAMDGGLYQGMSYLIGGRKKMGKTTLAGTISCNLNQQKVPHLFICAEMSAMEIHQRVIARMTQSYTSSFRNEIGKTADFQNKMRNYADTSNGCIIYQSSPGIPFDELKSSVAQAKSLYGIQGFILDSLQLVGGKSAKKSTAEHQDEVSQWCADFGRQTNLFSIITAQMNQMGNIRGGEGARMACDQAYEIHATEDDPSRSDRWLEMIETRYTQWMNIGSKESPALLMSEYGQFLYEPDYTNSQKEIIL